MSRGSTVSGWRDGGGVGLFGVCVFIRISNMGLCISVNVSFICRPVFVMSYVWYLSNVLSLGPFLSICDTFMVWSIVVWHVGALLSDSSVNTWTAKQWVGVTWPLRFRKWRYVHPHLAGCYSTLGKHSSTLGCDVTQQWSEVRFPPVRLWVYRRNWNS
jgi:hypothetical protein